MCPPEDKQHPPPVVRWRFVLIGLVCLCIGAGVLSANLLPNLRARYSHPVDNADIGDWSFGWPFWYGTATTEGPPGWQATFSGWVKRPDGSWTNPGWITRRPAPTPHRPSELTTGGLYYLLVNLFIACMLVVSPVLIGRARRVGRVGRGQFTLSGLFSLTTAVAIVLALFAVERRYNCAETNDRLPSIYSALSARPLFDQVAISIGIVCTLYVAIAALCQVFRLAVMKLRRLGKK